jgi:hypothetical protein
MTADIIRTLEKDIAGVRVQLDWRGRPVLQIQRRRVTVVLPFSAEHPADNSEWRDARRKDAIEVAQYLAALQDKQDPVESK